MTTQRKRLGRITTVFLCLLLAAFLLAGCFGTQVVIRFNLNGGTFSDESAPTQIVVEKGAEKVSLPTPQRKGYSFVGWFADREFITPVSSELSGDEIPKSSVTYYAKWDRQDVSVTFYVGETAVGTIDVKYGDVVHPEDFPDIGSYEGFAFEQTNITVTYDMEIYAKEVDREDAEHTVTYFVPVDDGYSVHARYKGKKGERISVPDNPSSTSEAYFSDWCFDKDGTDVCKTLPTEIGDRDLKLYAKYVDTDADVRYFYYDTLSANSLVITGLTAVGSYQPIISVPTEIDGVRVTKIGGTKETGFASRFVESIVIPDTITEIGDYAFAGCSALREVVFVGNAVTRIGKYAFAECVSLEKIALPSNVTVLDDRAFSGEGKDMTLSEITFPTDSKLSRIGDYAFSGCALLQEVTLGTVMSEFNHFAFAGSGIKEVNFGEGGRLKGIAGGVYSADGKTLLYYSEQADGAYVMPDGVTTIDDHAFYKSASLTSFTAAATLTTVGASAFEGCENLTEANLRQTVLRTLGARAFYGCGSLQNIGLPATLRTLGEQAFYECKQLKTAVMNDSTPEEIGPETFYGCESLTAFSVPLSVVRIGDYAFYGCRAMRTFTMSSRGSLREVGDYALYGCVNVGSVLFTSGVKRIGAYAFSSQTEKMALEFNADSSLSGIEYYGEGAFMNTNVSQITISGNIATDDDFGKYVFKNCSSLQQVTFSASGYETVPEGLFHGCALLRTITLSSNVMTVDDYAFYNCSSLESVQFGSVRKIGESAFEGCLRLVNGGANNRVLPATLTELSPRAFYACRSLTAVNVPSGLAIIPAYAFYDCTTLTSIVYDADTTLSTIGEKAFGNCTSLTRAVLPTTLALRDEDDTEGMVKNPFAGCLSLSDYAFNGTTEGDLFAEGGVIYRRLRTLGSDEYSGEVSVYAFPTAKSTARYQVPASITTASGSERMPITEIDRYAFFGTTIPELDFSANAQVGGWEEVDLLKIGDYAFAESSVTNVKITYRVYDIGARAFSGGRLTSVDIDDLYFRKGATDTYNIINRSRNVTSNALTIGAYAFADTSIVEFRAPARVERIGEGAFASDYSLTKIQFVGGYYLGGKITDLEIGDYAFAGDILLQDVVIPNNVTALGAYAFYQCNNLETITFEENGEKPLDIGAYAFGNAHYLYSVSLPSNVRTLGEGVFSQNTRLKYVYFAQTQTAGVAGLEIPANAFVGATVMTEMSLPAYITAIGERAFRNTSLRSIRFSGLAIDEPLTIGEEAFAYLTTLVEIDLPGNLVRIEDGAFRESALATFTLSETGRDLTVGARAFAGTKIEAFNAIDRIKSIGEGVFENTPSLTTFIAGNGLTEIPAYAFSGCGNLTEATLSSSITSIGDYAFRNTFFRSLPNANVRTIGTGAFTSSAITDVSIQTTGNVEIKEKAFENAFYLTSFRVETDEGLTVETKSFYACKELKDLRFTAKTVLLQEGFAADATRVGEEAFVLTETGEKRYLVTSDRVVYTADGKKIVYYPPRNEGSTYELTEDVEKIGGYAFYNATNLTGLIVRGEAVVKEENAFGSSDTQMVVYVREDRTNYYANEWAMRNIVSGTTVLGGMILEIQSTGGYLLQGYLGNEENVSIDGNMSENGVRYSITEIGENAFRNNNRIKTLVIGSGVKTIGRSAFRGCTALTSVSIGENVTSIKGYAFCDCTNLTSVRFANEGSLTGIGNYAFAYDGALEQAVIPDTVETVGIFAFAGCGIRTLVIGKRVEEIGNNAFEGCVYLTSVTFPASVQKLGNFVFNGCEDISYLAFEGDAVCEIEKNTFGGISDGIYFFVKNETVEKAYKSDAIWRLRVSKILSAEHRVSDAGYENYVVQRDGNTLRLLAYLGTESAVTLQSRIRYGGSPAVLTEIGEYAFGKFVEELTITEGFTTITDRAFYYAENLRTITMPDTMEAIGAYAFARLTNLQDVRFGERSALKEIGAYAFYRNARLTNIVLPDSLESIGTYAFAEIGFRTFAFKSGAKSASGISIGAYAFSGNPDWQTVTFTVKILYIGNGAFAGCRRLESMYFSYVPARGETNLAPTVDDADKIFLDCDKLNVILPTEALLNEYRNLWNEKKKTDAKKFVQQEYVADDFVYALIGSSNYVTIVNYLGADSSVTFPAKKRIGLVEYTVTRIGRETNGSNTEIRGYVIGDNVTKVTIPETVQTIGKDAFRNSVNLETVDLPAGSRSNLRTIESYAFAGCKKLKGITIPTSVQNIEAYAFYDCDALNEGFSFEEGLLMNDSTTLILGAYAFAECDALASVYIPNHVSIIGGVRSSGVTLYGHTFDGCKALCEITFSRDARLTKVEAYSFANTALREISFPASTEEVMGYVFSGCTTLENVYLERTVGGGVARVTAAAETVFEGVSDRHVKVYVPTNDFDVYASAGGWKEKTVIRNNISNDGRFAYEAGKSGNDLYIVITDYRGSEEELLIPREITVSEGIGTITTLGPYFANDTVRKVTFPTVSGVSSIGEYAFAYCTALEEIHLPNSVTSLGVRAFEGCTALTDLTLSEGISEIREFTFYNCTALREITLPSGITTGIGPSAFYRCLSLARVKVDFEVSKNNVGKTLGNSAFGDVGRGAGGLTIIVADDLYDIFNPGWESVKDLIYAESSVIGDFVVRSNDRGTELTLVQYLGTETEIDLTTLRLKGLPVTGIAANALGNDYTTFLVGEGATYPSEYANRVTIVVGDCFVRSNGTGLTLARYTGTEDEVDLTTFTVNGSQIGSIEAGAFLGNGYTKFLVTEGTTYPAAYKDRIIIKKD